MQKMMTYSEANSVLGSSLTPTNRCLSKSVAIANDADPDLLTNFDNARLVPASVVQPGSSWLDEHTITHVFIDENGNIIGDGSTLNIILPAHGEVLFVRTKALLDGQPFPDYMKGGSSYADDQHPTDYKYIHNEGCISERDYNVYSNNSGTPSSRGMINHAHSFSNSMGPKADENGISTNVIACNLDYSRASEPGSLVFCICMNDDFARPLNINRSDVVDNWNITLNVDRLNIGYDTTRGYIDFKKQPIGQQSADTTLTGFGSGPDDYEIQYIGYYIALGQLYTDSEGKLTEITKNSQGTSFIVTRTGDAIKPEGHIAKRVTFNIYRIYKKTDPSTCIYFVIRLEPIDS